MLPLFAGRFSKVQTSHSLASPRQYQRRGVAFCLRCILLVLVFEIVHGGSHSCMAYLTNHVKADVAALCHCCNSFDFVFGIIQSCSHYLSVSSHSRSQTWWSDIVYSFDDRLVQRCDCSNLAAITPLTSCLYARIRLFLPKADMFNLLACSFRCPKSKIS